MLVCVGEVSVYVFAVCEIERVVGMCTRSCVSTAVIRMTMRVCHVCFYISVRERFCTMQNIYSNKNNLKKNI